jgi:hypothetical protein
MTAKQMLTILLRGTGIVMMLAAVFVFCPFGWMQETHRLIGLGELPFTPLMGYLTRSLSGMYALMGFLLFYLSMDLVRYLPAIRAFTWASLGAVFFLTVYDFIIDLPWFWKIGEGASTIVLCIVILYLCHQTGISTPSASQEK